VTTYILARRREHVTLEFFEVSMDHAVDPIPEEHKVPLGTLELRNQSTMCSHLLEKDRFNVLAANYWLALEGAHQRVSSLAEIDQRT